MQHRGCLRGFRVCQGVSDIRSVVAFTAYTIQLLARRGRRCCCFGFMCFRVIRSYTMYTIRSMCTYVARIRYSRIYSLQHCDNPLDFLGTRGRIRDCKFRRSHLLWPFLYSFLSSFATKFPQIKSGQ